ncbi:MAG: N-formylglutamate amidohydrolase [Micavibrio sp.]
MTPPVLLHIPHSSTDIPEIYRSKYLISAEDLALENLRLTDLYTDELYDLPGAERAVFPVSRFLVDAERFCDDAQEPMAARGMGVLYTATTGLQKLREIPGAEVRAALLNRFYHPHHKFLNDWADDALTAHGRCLLIDCHSFPSRALPYELENQNLPRPEICIGTDSFHTPAELTDAMRNYFEDHGYWVGIDAPFSGALTPGNHFGRNKGVKSFMIEVRKDLYMNESTGEKNAAFESVRSHLTEAMHKAVECLNLYAS